MVLDILNGIYYLIQGYEKKNTFLEIKINIFVGLIF